MSDALQDPLRDLAPGYALEALSPEEIRAFEAAMAGSPELQREVAEYRELSALLALSDERPPAAELKERLRARIHGDKPVATPSRPAARPPRRSNFTAFALGLGLAAAVVLAVGLSLKVRRLTDALGARDSVLAERERKLAEREATLNAILEPSVQLTTLTATGVAAPVLQVFWDRARHSLILHSFNLPPAPSGRAYQLWLMRKKGNPIPSQVFNTEPTGRQLVQSISVPAGEEIVGFALTVEPAGGSPQPTSTPILYGAVPGL
jgi:anti-sigma-K factor RskA